MRAQLVRTAVLEIYEEVRREGARADQALQRVLRREKQLRSVERRAVSDAVYGLLRLQGKVDALLARALATRDGALQKLATPTQHLLRYAAWLIAGWVKRNSSISRGEIFSPPRMTTSFSLPVILKLPSGRRMARSPVCTQPSLSMACALSRWRPGT